MPSYRVPAATASAEIREKGSRFLAVILPATSEAEAKAALAGLAGRHPDATHHCWAWRLGFPPRERSADAGEPAGTAGLPILTALRGAGLSDALAVVARWFGGTKLGKGGLVRAYGAATREALAALAVRLRISTVPLTVELPYDKIGAVKRLIHPPEVELVAEEYGAAARLRLEVAEERLADFTAALADLGLPASSVLSLKT
jgi:uncharacterized YigZ family protein